MSDRSPFDPDPGYHAGHRGPRPPKGKIASVADRVRGCIAIALTITCFSIAYNAADQQVQIPCMIAGILYFCTSLAIVFKDMD